VAGGAEHILLTGGTGRLGRELRSLMPDLAAPPRSELDVTRPETIAAAVRRRRPDVLVHAAAFTDVAAAERDRATCWRVNVEGTRNVVRAAVEDNVFLVYISTDYVFEGAAGGYKEDDTPGPPCNTYALTKLVAEQLVRLADHHLVIRTSFRPREWPYPVAFTDAYTSQDYVDVIAPDIALAIRRCRDVPWRTLHVATERKSAFELARRRRPDVRPAARSDADVPLPYDVSLDVSRWQQLKAEWSRE